MSTKTIWKFPIDIVSKQRVVVPYEAEILHVGLDPAEQPCIWCLVEPGNTQEPIDLFIVGTGHPAPFDAEQHIGSFVQKSFVWHVFTK